jgi:hypothetical protein
MTSNAPRRNNPALPRNASTILDPPTTSRSTGSTSTNPNPIRRNLFPQAARRQLRHDGASSSTSTSTVREHHSSSNETHQNNDIIIRDPLSGNFTIDAPQLPAPREITQEDEEKEARERMIEAWGRMGSVNVSGLEDQQGEFDTFSSSARARARARERKEENGAGDTVVFDDDMEDLNKKLSEAANPIPSSAEIKAVLMTSLDEKLASLDEDGWMFGDDEKEEDL